MNHQIKNGDKLYIVTRKDLSPGYQAVQSCHALRQFTEEHPEIDKAWFDKSNYLALLSVDNEQDLLNLIEQAENLNIKFSIFREPDIDNAITAITLAPCDASRRICSKIKLALGGGI